MSRSLGWLLPTVFVVSGCGSTSPKPAFDDVAKLIADRSGHHLFWNQGTEEDRQVDAKLTQMLDSELTAEQAVAIALLNNHTLQSVYEDLSVAQADLVQAGLLKNPVLSGAIGFSSRTSSPNLFAGVGWDFLDVFTRSARKKIADTELEAVKLRVGGAVLGLVYDVRAAYYMLQGAMQVTAMRREVADAAQIAADIAKRQSDAGNVSELDLVNQEAQAEQLKMDAARSEADVRAAREQLTRLMGIWGKHDHWKIGARLPELPDAEIDLGKLESLAIAQRLDVAAARKEAEALDQAASLTSQTRLFAQTNVGATYTRTPVENETSIGPTLGLELPIFDQRQAVVAKVDAEARRAEQRLAAVATDARSEVRVVRDRLTYLRQIAEGYRTTIIPTREKSVSLTQQQFNAMLMGVYQLLAAKQAEVTSYREYIETVRDYWIARADLERAVGGRLFPNGDEPGIEPPHAAPPSTPAAPPPAMDHAHHSH